MIVRVPAYERLADHYDGMLSSRMFPLLARNFERLRDLLNLQFRDAADLGCGTGLFASYLSRRFQVPVFAVDRSPAMLRRAVYSCKGLPVVLLRQDLRHLSLPGPVDLATSNYDTVNHLVRPCELLEVLKRIALHLRPGGHFIADLLTPMFGRSVGCGRQFRYKSRTSPREVVQQVRSLPPELVSVRILECDGTKQWLENHWERLYRLRDFCDMARKAGLRLKWAGDAITLIPAVWEPVRAVTVFTH